MLIILSLYGGTAAQKKKRGGGRFVLLQSGVIVSIKKRKKRKNAVLFFLRQTLEKWQCNQRASFNDMIVATKRMKMWMKHKDVN